MKAVKVLALLGVLGPAGQWGDSGGRTQARHLRYESLTQSPSQASELSQASDPGRTG